MATLFTTLKVNKVLDAHMNDYGFGFAYPETSDENTDSLRVGV
jgi:hypothetical protein